MDLPLYQLPQRPTYCYEGPLPKLQAFGNTAQVCSALSDPGETRLLLISLYLSLK